MPAEAVILPILFVSFFAVVGYWIHARQRRQREVLAAQQDLQTRILERFDSAQEFSHFLQTEGGRRFLAGLTDERGWRPARRIMAAVQIGIVITALGLGLFVLANVVGNREVAWPGIMILFLGLGFLASAAASWLMSKKWGLLPGDDARASSALTDEAV
jgi:hypothetical protein